MSNELKDFTSSSGKTYSKSEAELMLAKIKKYESLEEWQKYFRNFYKDEDFREYIESFTAEEKKPKGSYRWFGCVLYEEDPVHQDLKAWFLNDYVIKAYHTMMIMHDLDIDEDGGLKKPHYHVLFQMPKPYGINSVLRFFGGSLKHVTPETDIQAACMYFLHLTPDAFLDEKKHIYSCDEVLGDISGYNNIIQNANHAYNQAVVILLSRGNSLIEILQNDSVTDGLKDYIFKHMSLCSSLERSAYMAYARMKVQEQ